MGLGTKRRKEKIGKRGSNIEGEERDEKRRCCESVVASMVTTPMPDNFWGTPEQFDPKGQGGESLKVPQALSTHALRITRPVICTASS